MRQFTGGGKNEEASQVNGSVREWKQRLGQEAAGALR